jgi:hypothetical protein
MNLFLHFLLYPLKHFNPFLQRLELIRIHIVSQPLLKSKISSFQLSHPLIKGPLIPLPLIQPPIPHPESILQFLLLPLKPQVIIFENAIFLGRLCQQFFESAVLLLKGLSRGSGRRSRLWLGRRSGFGLVHDKFDHASVDDPYTRANILATWVFFVFAPVIPDGWR